MVETPAEEFGDAGIVRLKCDRTSCGRPITLNWKGRDGNYCSNACRKMAEGEDTAMTANEASESPIKGAGAAPAKAPAERKAPAKGKAKAAPAKKAPAKKAAGAAKAKAGKSSGGRTAELVAALEKGATVEGLMKQFGWNENSARWYISNLRGKGHKVEKGDDGKYKIAKKAK